MLTMDPYTSFTANEFQFDKPKQFGIKELLEDENHDWQAIQDTFKSAATGFEELLFKIHYKRKKTLTVLQRSAILKFLSVGYMSTNDIRYFNEFLWFYQEKDNDKSLKAKCIQVFNANLNKNGCHHLPYQLDQHLPDKIINSLNEPVYHDVVPLRICLIGFPPFFGKIMKKLKKEGHHVEQFFLPYHPNHRINQLLKFRFPVKLLSVFSGNFYAYRTLDFHYKDERISQVLKAGNFDIGFHKLNFIIKENIFNAFKKGLLNDHWGYLPLLRGKSTIAYSLLLNIPVVPTIHFIDKGIDSGSVAGYFPCNYSKAKTVKEVRGILRKKMPERAVAAIKLTGSAGFVAKDNIKEKGLTFYEIHPWLNDHIASCILKQ